MAFIAPKPKGTCAQGLSAINAMHPEWHVLLSFSNHQRPQEQYLRPVAFVTLDRCPGECEAPPLSINRLQGASRGTWWTWHPLSSPLRGCFCHTKRVELPLDVLRILFSCSYCLQQSNIAPSNNIATGYICSGWLYGHKHEVFFCVFPCLGDQPLYFNEL